MTVQEVIDYFGGIPATAAALDVTYEAIRQWQERGLVPPGRQWELQYMTDGKLKADNNKSA